MRASQGGDKGSGSGIDDNNNTEKGQLKALKPILCILQSVKNIAENIASTQAGDYQVCS